jgi:hypothetical protein
VAESCCCGNVTDASVEYVRRVSPCRCKKPGTGGCVTKNLYGLPDWVSEKHYQQRKRTGLPMITDIEQAATSRWK